VVLAGRRSTLSVMRRLIMALAACGLALACSTASTQSPFPRLLPPADDFHLTLREDSQSNLPLGPSCTGEAALALPCHAFTVALENNSQHTIRLSSDCKEPDLMISIKEPHTSGGWLPVSRRSDCRHDIHWGNLRLQPGERVVFQTRLISPSRYGESMLPRSYTLRAGMTLWGCTEPPDHSDCLSPLQATPTPGSWPEINYQEPVGVVSNEIIAESPPLPDFGKMDFTFQVEIPAIAPGNTVPTTDCWPQNNARLDCTTFRYTIRNLGDRAVRNVVSNCNAGGVTPDIAAWYRVPGGEWKGFPIRNGVCFSAFTGLTAIPAGGEAEGEFTLATLEVGLSTKPLEVPDRYQLRFTFSPHACFASPDGRFCLTALQHPAPVVSPELAVDVR
jgi:hypothetical protein